MDQMTRELEELREENRALHAHQERLEAELQRSWRPPPLENQQDAAPPSLVVQQYVQG